MNKNVVLVLLIFLVPLCAYWGLTRDKNFTALPSDAAQGPQIIKFASPMCSDCQSFEVTLREVYPKYVNRVTLHEIDVTKRDNKTARLVQDYQVRLVPTIIFKNSNGQVTRRIEGSMEPNVFEGYVKEIINE